MRARPRRGSARATDPLILAAIGEAPPIALRVDGQSGLKFVPFVDPDALSLSRAARLRISNPAGAELLDQLGRFAE